MPESSTMATAPPPYFRTVYDETLRAITYTEPSIMSMGNNPNLLGQLEYHSPTTDDSFSICVAGGDGIFVSQVLIIIEHAFEQSNVCIVQGPAGIDPS